MAHSRLSRIVLSALALGMTLGVGPQISLAETAPVTPPTYADQAFQQVWERYDRPVFYGEALRSWTWGNQITGGSREPYAEGTGGEHLVQYFDKSRMEINNPSGDRSAAFYVTQGLLARDMIRGEVQEGNTTFRAATPAAIPFGDLDDPSAQSPTYASLKGVLDAPPIVKGSAITQRIDRAGNVTGGAESRGVTSAGIVDGQTTNHAMASVFYEFLQRSGVVYENGQNVTTAIFTPLFYVSGMPITEAYWATIRAAGQPKEVLIQCFERRCLTYTPSNEPEWRVELANTGLQYHVWRTGPGASPSPSPSPSASPSASPSPTPAPSSEPGPSASPTPSPSPSPSASPSTSPAPSASPSPSASPAPSASPSPAPSASPSPSPSPSASPAPSTSPEPSPSPSASPAPSALPSPSPSPEASPSPSPEASPSPSPAP